MLKAVDIMQKDLVTVSKETSISEVITILAEKKITGLPVVDDDMVLVGLVSEKDVLRVAYCMISGSDVPTADDRVEKVMATELVFFSPDDNIADICQCFLDRSIRRVPVVDSDGKIVGVISRKDVIIKAYEANKALQV
jgi:CBS domain-containing protein